MINKPKLRAFVEEIIARNYSIVVQEDPRSSIKENRPSTILRADVAIRAGDFTYSLPELAITISTLLDAQDAEYLLSPEGKVAQQEALGAAMFIVATNPKFSAEIARNVAADLLDPFAAAINILERHGYSVTYIKEQKNHEH